jgi:2-dehydro-3-deoxygluconokinase
MHPEVVTFGESMASIMPAAGQGLERAAILNKGFGGAESNLAIGLARLGHRAGWFGKLGADPIGTYILKTIRGEGVDVSRAIQSADGPTGLMLRESVNGRSSVYYYRKWSAMSRMTPADLDSSYIAGAKVLHVTGITLALSESCRRTVEEAVRIARENGVKVSFDPNLRLKLWSVEEAQRAILPLAEQADYFLPGLDELKLLLGTDDLDRILHHVNGLDAVTVLRGIGEENWLLDRGNVTKVPFVKAERVVDTVGAGDAFCAGFLSGVLSGDSLVEAVRLGNLLGALCVQTEGDWEGLPTRNEVEQALGRRSHVER